MAHAKTGGEKGNATQPLTIWLIGELGGATLWFSKENAIGLYGELEERVKARSNVPSIIVFHGEVLPAFPRYITGSGHNKVAALQDNIESLDLAVVAIKPHLTRLAETVARTNAHTKFVYVYGVSDFENIALLHDQFVEAYTYTPRTLGEQLLAYYHNKILANQQIIENTKEVLNKELNNGKDGKEHELKIYNLKEKIRQLEEEKKDYTKTFKLIRQLFVLWIQENAGTTSIDAIYEKLNPKRNPELDSLIVKTLAKYTSSLDLDRLKQEYDNTTAELKRVDKSKNLELYKRLDARSKELANLIKKATYRELRKQEKQRSEAIHASGKAGELYTHNFPGSPSLDKLATAIAYSLIETNIKNAFGRRRVRLYIGDEKTNDIELANTLFRFSTLPSNASRVYTSEKTTIDQLNFALHKSGNMPFLVTTAQRRACATSSCGQPAL